MQNKSAIIIILLLFQLTARAQQTYQLDVKKSKITWKLKIMGGHYGYLLFNSGRLIYSPAGQPVSGSFIMDMNTIRSQDHALPQDNQKVDKKLRTPGFLNIDQYTAAVMTVKQITATGNQTYKVSGDLTIKNITNPVEFIATIKPIGNTITATGSLVIAREKWKINVQPEPKSWDFIATLKDKIMADDIYITLNLVFNK